MAELSHVELRNLFSVPTGLLNVLTAGDLFIVCVCTNTLHRVPYPAAFQVVIIIITVVGYSF